MREDIDVKVAIFLKRALNYYINKRKKMKTFPNREEIWEGLFSENEKIIFPLDEDVKILLYKESQLCQAIYFGFEEAEMEFVKNFLHRGDVFIDVGCNIGIFSLMAAKEVGEEGKVYSVEPTPVTCSRFMENVELNNFKNIQLFEVGLSNSNGSVQFNISNNGFDAWNSITKPELLGDISTIEIEVKSFDDFIKENAIPDPNLVKIDVEGWEKFVLQGATGFLSNEKAPVFMIEFTESNAFSAGYYLGEIYDFMEQFGYRWYSYNMDNNSLINEVKKLHYPYENLLAIKDYDMVISKLK